MQRRADCRRCLTRSLSLRCIPSSLYFSFVLLITKNDRERDWWPWSFICSVISLLSSSILPQWPPLPWLIMVTRNLLISLPSCFLASYCCQEDKHALLILQLMWVALWTSSAWSLQDLLPLLPPGLLLPLLIYVFLEWNRRSAPKWWRCQQSKNVTIRVGCADPSLSAHWHIRPYTILFRGNDFSYDITYNYSFN